MRTSPPSAIKRSQKLERSTDRQQRYLSTVDRIKHIRISQVVVDDVNDHRPRFIGTTPYHAAIAENSPPGSRIVFTVSACAVKTSDVFFNQISSVC